MPNNQHQIVKARIRGIYATAITKILLDNGVLIVQASPIIRHRLGLPENNTAPDVTVKTLDDDPHTLLVIGFPDQVDTVSRIIEEHVEEYIKWESKLGLYSIVKGVIIEKRNDECLVKLPHDITSILKPCSEEEGNEVIVSVAKTRLKPNEPVRITKNIRIIGYYAAIIDGEAKVTISEHIRNYDKRAELLTIASNTIREGYGVHWRSSAGYANVKTLLSELEELKKKIKDIKDKAVKAQPLTVVYPGEKIVLLTLPSTAKRKLDEIRSKVTPTTPYHHTAKALGNEIAVIVDFAEKLLSNKWITMEQAYQGILEYIADKLKEARKIEIYHIKPEGKILKLTPGKIESLMIKSNRIILELKRIFKTRGVYDGLGIEKEPGDYDIMRIDTSSWTIIHRYYDKSGNLKGEYININTPPEVTTNKIVYHDLAIDIVKTENETKIIDIDEYIKLLKEGVISQTIHNKVVEEIKKYGIDLEKEIETIKLNEDKN